MSMPLRTRRIIKRHPASVPVYILAGDGFLSCQTRNISRGGVFVESDNRSLRRGQQVQLVFPQEQGNVVRMRRYTATVAHVTFHGLGFRFSRPGDYSTAI